MNKRTLTLALTVLSVWLFAGCFQTETMTTIDSKGGMDRKVDIAIAEASKDQLKSKKEAFDKDGWTTSEETKDGKYHLMASKKWADAKEFADPFGDTKVTVELKDKKVFFTEVFEAKKSAGITDTNRTAWSELKYTFHVTMPSKIETSNADKTEGSKATWEFDYNEVFDQGTFTMTAEASEGGGMCGSTMIVTGLGLGLFLLAIKFLFSFAMANRRRAKAVMQN